MAAEKPRRNFAEKENKKTNNEKEKQAKKKKKKKKKPGKQGKNKLKVSAKFACFRHVQKVVG